MSLAERYYLLKVWYLRKAYAFNLLFLATKQQNKALFLYSMLDDVSNSARLKFTSLAQLRLGLGWFLL